MWYPLWGKILFTHLIDVTQLLAKGGDISFSFNYRSRTNILNNVKNEKLHSLMSDVRPASEVCFYTLLSEVDLLSLHE